ncbi:MAG: glycosyl hydrolase [Opitutaceae bacterium]|nr:glycosyl hydrolase [Opitutaceae bacterium]
MPVLFACPLAFAQTAPATDAIVSISPADITQLFIQADAPALLAFRPVFREIPRPSGFSVAYQISDYEGRVVTGGKAVSDTQGALAIRAALPAGFYEIAFASSDARFDTKKATGVWSIAKTSPPPPANDGYYSLDTALSWLVEPQTQKRSPLIKNLRHVVPASGLIRERLSWKQINPAQNEYEWETAKSCESIRKLYAASGIKILEMFHDAPDWVGAISHRFPADLVGSNRSWRDIARRWHTTWGALEVWNEADANSKQPADQLVPLLKTVRHALRTDGIATPLVGGVFTSPQADYLNLAAENGLLDECEIVSAHYYFEDPLALQSQVAQYRRWLAAHGHESKPLWFTEIGALRYKETPGVRPSLRSQAATGLIYAMQAIELKTCGIARIFPFVYTDYFERNGTLSFGMLDRQNTPLRILVASAQAGKMLAGMEYAGDIPKDSINGAKLVRVFTPAARTDTALVVVYTGGVSANKTLTLPFPAQSAQGVDGRVLKLTDGGKTVPAPDGLVYLRVAHPKIRRILKKDTSAMRLWRIGKTPPPPLPPVANIVLQPKIARENVQTISSRGYFLPEGRETFSAIIIVNNLGNAPRTVTLNYHVPAVPVSVPANSRVEVPVGVSVASLPPPPRGDDRQRRLTITATSDDGSRIAPVALTLIPPTTGEKSIGDWLRESRYQFRLPIGDLARWRPSAIDKLTFMNPPPDGAEFGFSVKFGERLDLWAYPEFTVPHEIDLSRVTAVLIRARCARPATVKMLSWPRKGSSDGEHYTRKIASGIIPADGEWHVACIPLSSYVGFLAPGDDVPLAKISIGFNSRELENSLEIGDLYYIGQ